MLVVICVYNRFDNIKRWIDCWQQCEQHGAELVIIHNYYNNNAEKKRFKALCDSHKIKYVPSNKQGFDIGRFQDVCKDRLTGFPEWDKLLWLCDDTLPMSKDFLTPFLNKFIEGVGVVCMDLSPWVRTHIRTTGFLISKETAQKLTFKVDPISTKEDCYQFEHRDPENYFYKQVIEMGLKVVQVDLRETSPLWDQGYHRGLKRYKEHVKVFSSNKTNKVVFICPIFDAFPEIISSLICQTHKEWELLLIDDNPEQTTTSEIIKATGDKRINYIKRPRVGEWGHPLRKWALEEIRLKRLATDADYVVITNGDNYYVPTFCEYILEGFQNPEAVAVYCDQMIHSYKRWAIIPCSLRRGFIDCGGVMIKKDIACETGWQSMEHSSDWIYFNSIISKYGADKWVKVKGALFVHN